MTTATIERTTVEYSPEVTEAAELYLARRDRMIHPAGEFDSGGRFYLSSSERCECCETIRTPSRRFPYSEMVHARTAIHCAHMLDVSPTEVRRAAKELDS